MKIGLTWATAVNVVIDSLLEGARRATGVVAVIDVFRAFTSAAVALANGASRIVTAVVVEDLGHNPFFDATPEYRQIEREKYRIVYSLVGGIGVPPVQPPGLPGPPKVPVVVH